MNFKVGDRVLVLDEAISGKVSKIISNTVIVLTDDGFELEFLPYELLVQNDTTPIKSQLFSGKSLNEIISEKEHVTKRKSIKIKPKERTQPTMEVDLHIHQLTERDRQMSNYEMLDLQLQTAKRQLEFAINKRIQKIVFIHGVGEGVLKAELVTLFGRYENIKYYDADYQKYGLGATEVYIYQNVKD
jgi:S-adenosylmethionine:tRNA-ribosyltransferase-isomerase (queuine synthetase)